MTLPEDDDIVVRGGTFVDANALLESIEDAVDLGYGPVLSVFVGPRESHRDFRSCVRDICVDAQVPHGKVRLSSPMRLRAQGFELIHDTSDGQPESHFHVLFPDDPTSVDVARFIACFDAPILNPAKEINQ